MGCRDVPEDQVRFAKVGDSVRITMNAYPGEVFAGRVMRVGDLVDPTTRTIKVRAQLANPQERFRLRCSRNSGSNRVPSSCR